ncbi:BatA domain-containing protein [Corallibacter sp.]|uniref:BatA domain-containing protein n=1 Tax=Corallibacter sp. TaxID=2038084 RepID=UPI003AB72B27
MQFKHPELLYALFLLIIPIIIHLFQLRRFKKVAFTNVAFLKNVKQQTRKSSQIKKWLTLITRLLLFACIILAFAQPYTSNKNSFNTTNETVIYLDNSFSMQAKGKQGELLKRAVQDIIDNTPDNENITLITNNETFRNTQIKTIKNDLLQLNYTPNQLTYEAALIKSKNAFSKNSNSLKHLIFISDFQEKDKAFIPVKDSLINIHAVQLKPETINNVSIDSLYIAKTTATNTTLTVTLKNSGSEIENLPVSLYNDTMLIAKTSVSIKNEATTTFEIPNNTTIKGHITIDDTALQFDNSCYFSINKPSKIQVLAISDVTDSFLSRIYSDDEFNYTNTSLGSLNYSNITKQNLIILNELKTIPEALSRALNEFQNNGGFVVVINSQNAEIPSYNTFLATNNIKLNALGNFEKRVTTINYAHPLFGNVFDNKVDNFQYPKVSSFYTVASGSTTSALSFEDGQPFLVQQNNLFLFTAALNTKNSNFSSSPLIVPTFYNIGKQSLKTPNIYYTIGKENTYDVAVNLSQDAVLKLEQESISIIPQQQYYNNKVAVTTFKTPDVSGVYNLMNNKELVKYVSYNYDRNESNMTYQNLSALEQINISHDLTKVFNTIKSNSKVNELWKWFVIFALAFLIFEMLILKYFK